MQQIPNVVPGALDIPTATKLNDPAAQPHGKVWRTPLAWAARLLGGRPALPPPSQEECHP